MSLDTWSVRNVLLTEFRSAIERRTHGRLSHLSLDVIDGALVVKASSATYYAVQLALTAIEAFVVDFPKLTPAKMSFRINGHPLVLGNPNADSNGQAISSNDRFDGSDSMLRDQNHDKQSPSPLVSLAATTAVI